MLSFRPGEIYRRSEIHDEFGGNRQNGISTSARQPYIFIFSGKSGELHGYKDEWLNDQIYCYTGEGQSGDMRFIKGNLALREHLKRKKRVLLFKHFQKGFVQFETELEFQDFDYFEGKDSKGKLRTAIKFFFRKAGERIDYIIHSKNENGKDVIVGGNFTPPNETERKGLVTSRVGQGAYRKSILHRWKFKCAVTGYENASILIASHIVAWKDSDDFERLDVANGILLSPVYDALFDTKLIGFENSGKIILSTFFSASNYKLIGITGKEAIGNLQQDNIPYLERHRELLTN